MNKLSLFSLILIVIFFVACDSSVVDEPITEEDEALVGLTINNTQGITGPANPDKLVLRLWQGHSSSSSSNILRFVDFPNDGESREINVKVPPGDYWVGLIAYNSQTGNASFYAISEDVVEFINGENNQINFEDDLFLLNEDLIVSIGSTFQPEEDFRISTFRVPRSEHLFSRSSFNINMGTLFYDSQTFTGDTSSNQSDIVGGSFSYFVPFSTIEVTEDLLDGFFVRIQYDLPSTWRLDDQGPTNITRPDFSENPINMLEEEFGSGTINFLEVN